MSKTTTKDKSFSNQKNTNNLYDNEISDIRRIRSRLRDIIS